MSSVEWSGVLFYTTEGTFGQEDFKCIAEELYLMDIGTSGYTEYEYGPDFVKHLMDNPRLRPMQKGHIHSHNRMSVFFSGTDTDELHSNSEHHNFYLSLIVNNDNDMVAKIAFRAVQTSLKLEFKNAKGELVTETLKDKTEFIFVHDCEIELPEMGKLEEMNGRIEEMRKSPNSSARGGSRTRFLDETSQSTKDKKPTGSNVEKRLYEFVVKLIDQSPKGNKSLSEVLGDLNIGLNRMSPTEVHRYLAKMQSNCASFYQGEFPEDRKFLHFKTTIGKAIDVLKNYSDKYPELIEELTDKLKVIKQYDYADDATREYDYDGGYGGNWSRH